MTVHAATPHMKVMATASLMLLALFSGCSSAAFAPTARTEGHPASLGHRRPRHDLRTSRAIYIAPSVGPLGSFDLPDAPPDVTVARAPRASTFDLGRTAA